MSDKILDDIPHRRYNPLRGSWVLVSPHRTKRPWQGQQEAPSKGELPEYDPSCYLCPGNRRAQGDTNPDYKHTYVFANDYGAVKEHQERYEPEDDDPGSSACRRDPWNHLFVDAVDYLGSGRLLKAEPVTGKCYVVAFSPSHNITLADMSAEEIVLVVQKWTEMYASYISPSSCLYNKTENQHGNLERLDQGYRSTSAQYRYMQIFENKGPAMGCSNPHPHGQVWITTGLPEEPSLELEHLQRYRNEHAGHHMLEDYAKLERKKERVVFENSAFLVLCPWWAVWPFEVMILSKVHRCALIDLDRREQEQLAEAILEVTRRYDNLFETHFPYSMGIHQAPLEGTEEEIEASHLHLHFYPPLLRSATVRKFLVGYELMAEPQRDITPEQAAARLRSCDGELYRKRLERQG